MDSLGVKCNYVCTYRDMGGTVIQMRKGIWAGKMKTYKFWTFITLKSYFDTGLILTNYFTKLLMVIGIGWAVSDAKNIEIIIIFGLIYFVLCFFLGWAWWHFGFAETSQEFTNRYNPFVKEVRNGSLKFQKK